MHFHLFLGDCLLSLFASHVLHALINAFIVRCDFVGGDRIRFDGTCHSTVFLVLNEFDDWSIGTFNLPQFLFRSSSLSFFVWDISQSIDSCTCWFSFICSGDASMSASHQFPLGITVVLDGSVLVMSHSVCDFCASLQFCSFFMHAITIISLSLTLGMWLGSTSHR